MSQTRVWISIVSWAVAAALVAVAACLALSTFYPSIHPGVMAISAFLAAQVVYGVRAFARRRGWAMASYAPRGE